MTMESYWRAVLHEVENKSNTACSFKYTNVGPEEALVPPKPRKRRANPTPKKKFFVGESYPSVYFTQREFDCMVSLLRGSTVKEIAVQLELSPRTVEYYIKNLKTKMDCQTRSELLNRALQSDLIKEAMAKLEQ